MGSTIYSMPVPEQNIMYMLMVFMFQIHRLDHLCWQRITHIPIIRVDICREQDMVLRCGIEMEISGMLLR